MANSVKGLMLTLFVRYLRKNYSPEDMQKLEQECGGTNFSAFKNYPMEEEARFFGCAVRVFYPKDSDKGYREFGRVSLKIYADSYLGKTFFTLFNLDLKKAALSADKILRSLTYNVNLKVIDTGGNSFKIIVKDLPYPLSYYTGVWEEALDYFKKKGTVIAKKISPTEFEYLISWE